MKRSVAVKRLDRRAYSVLSDFKELSVPGRLEHPNIIAIYDVLEDSNVIVMEYAEGGSLRDKMLSDPRWVRDNFLRLMLEICEGLRAAHSANILHLDIKPDNILLTGSGSVKIADFGVCRLVESSEYADGHVGTLPYMAFEALRGERYRFEADVHSLGCVMYEILAGRLPWIAHGTLMAWNAVKNATEPSPLRDAAVGEVDDLLSQLVSRMLSKGPSRILNVDSVIQQLRYLDPTALQGSTIDDLQLQLGAIYGFANATRSPLYLLTQYLIAVRSTTNAMRARKFDEVESLFPKAFAWLCASATSLNLRLGQLVWLKYESTCPYCGDQVCKCAESWNRDTPDRNEALLERLHGRQANQASDPKPFRVYQAEFERMYGDLNRQEGLESTVNHAYSEVAEAMDAVIHLMPADDSRSLLAMQLEFSDLVAWFFALLNLYDQEYDLPDAVRRTFSDGCYACREKQCRCPEPLGVSNWRRALGVEYAL